MKIICPYCGSEMLIYTDQRIVLSINIDDNNEIIEEYSKDKRYLVFNKNVGDYQCKCIENGCYDGELQQLIQKYPNCIKRE